MPSLTCCLWVTPRMSQDILLFMYIYPMCTWHYSKSLRFLVTTSSILRNFITIKSADLVFSVLGCAVHSLWENNHLKNILFIIKWEKRTSSSTQSKILCEYLVSMIIWQTHGSYWGKMRPMSLAIRRKWYKLPCMNHSNFWKLHVQVKISSYEYQSGEIINISRKWCHFIKVFIFHSHSVSTVDN